MSTFEIMKREWSRMPPVIGRGRLAIAANLLSVGFVASLLPLAMGHTFLEPGPLISFATLSVFFVAFLVAGTFAGKESMLDMEDLLSGGAPDWAILLGKTGAAVVRGWSLNMAVVAVGVGIVILVYRSGAIPASLAPACLQAVVLSLAASWLVAIGGALISLRARSVKEAQANLKLAIVVGLLVAIDIVWFYPGDLLEVRYVAWIAAGLLLTLSCAAFVVLRERLHVMRRGQPDVAHPSSKTARQG
jgi:hypothetical protein